MAAASELHRLLLPLLACVLVAGQAVAKPTVVITVDVETTDRIPLTAQLDARCTDGEPCGLNRIESALAAHRYAGTFFLNVYEWRQRGLATMQAIAARLEDEGHEVGLHTHPQWAYDPKRPLLYTYSAAEQTRIIEDGVRLLEEWTHRPVISHRGGAYSADRTTIDILARNGVRADSSLFFMHPYSHLNGLGLARNRPSMLDGVLEMPVTVYWRREHPRYFAGLLPPFTTIRKFDVDSFLDTDEALSAMRAAVAADLPCIVVFLHSFSFLDGAGEPLVTDRKSIQVFESLLAFARQENLQVQTLRQIAATDPSPAAAAGADVIPDVSVTVPTYLYAAHQLHRQANRFGLSLYSAAAILAFVGLAIVAGITAIFVRRYRRVRLAPAVARDNE